MGTNKRIISVATLALLFFVASSEGTGKCRSGCQGVKPHLFKYNEGGTYKYKYESNIEISVSGSEAQQSTSSRISALVSVTPLKDCQYLLRLDKVQIFGPNPTKYDVTEIKKSVTFVFHDGHIEDEICTEPDESPLSLNIKRAVISLFQAATKHKTETDVFGTCPTSIIVSKEGAQTVIRKTRDLNRCSYRESIRQDFITPIFNPHSEVKSTLLLDSDYSSEQIIKNGIIQSAKVSEHYLYKPFSLSHSGAKTVVTTKLTFVNQAKESPKPKATEPRTILFENPHLINTPTSNVNNLMAALKKAVESNTADQVVSENAARDFAALINTLRATSKNDVLAVYGSVKHGAGVKDKVAAKKLFLEALYRAGTGDAIEVAIELLTNKEIPVDQQKILYLSLSFVKHATSKSLSTAAALLDQPHLPREAYLGIGTLAGRYCREHKCENDENVDKLGKKFVSKLGNCKTNDREVENTYVALLKGLGNFHQVSDVIVDALVNCAKDRHVQPRVRVAALEAFLGDASKQKVTKTALGILKNRDEDSEIRIKAYLVLVQSPSGEIANALKDLLATEPTNQVGAFIVSHLRNIRASTNPDKELAKQHLGLLRSSRRFPIDIRRFSFNSELSYAIDSLGLASSVESNVIYSQDSFLPRSAVVNITTEMFGHRLNLMELGMRQQNLDRLMEHYLGPRGVLETSDPSDLVENSKHEMTKLMEKIKQRLEKTKRGKRDVSEADLKDIVKAVKLLTSSSSLDLDLQLKLFGNEVLFITANEGIESLTSEAVVDKIFDLLDQGIETTKNFNYNVGSHIQYLDIELAYPTSAGFPLKMVLTGSGGAKFISSGSIDIRKIIQDPKNAKFNLKIIPSANINLVGFMCVDAQYVETGLQVTSSFHTATGNDLTVQLLNNGKGIDVKLQLPIEKQDVLTVTHDVVFATRELGHEMSEVPIKFATPRKEYHGCFDQLSQICGLTFCADVGFPMNSLPGITLGGVNTAGSVFPLTGPIKASVKIQRDDTKEYRFRAVYIDNQPDKRKLELSFDTPGSKVNRRINLVIEGGLHPDKYIKATLDSPIKKAIMEGRIINNNEEMSLNAKLAYDNQEYSAKVGARVSGNEASSRYTPLISLKTPQRGTDNVNGYKVEGAIEIEKTADGRKFKFDNVRLVSPAGNPIIVSGSIGKDGPKYEADLTVSQDKARGSIKGNIIFVSLQDIQLNGEFQNSLNPNLNLHVIAAHKCSPGEFSNKLEVVHGQDLSTSKNKFKLDNHVKHDIESYKKFDISTENKVEYPLLNVLVKANGRVTCHSINYDIEATYEKFKASSQLDAHINKKTTGDYDVQLVVEALNNKLLLKSSREITAPSTSVLKNLLEIQKRKYEFDATVVHQLESNNINAQLDAVLKMSDRPNAITIKEGLVYNPNSFDMHSEIKDGDQKFLDSKFKSNLKGNANGMLKFNVPNLIVCDGNVVVKDGKGTATLTVDLKKLNRKIKGDSSFLVSKPHYNINANLLLNADQDPSQKLSLSTENKITDDGIQSKNKIDVFGQVLEANLNGALKGKVYNGAINGDFDVTLPAGQYLAGKLNRDMTYDKGVVNAKGNAEIEFRTKKENKGHKVQASVVIKDTNVQEHVFDYVVALKGIKDDGQNVELDLTVKHTHSGEQRHSHASAKLGGSLLKSPIQGELNGDYSKKAGNYKATLQYGNHVSLSVENIYDLGKTAENKYSYDINAQLTTSNEKLKALSLKSSSAIVRPKTDTESFELTTSNVFGLNEKNVKIDASLRGNKDQGSGKISASASDDSPVTISANYKRESKEAFQVNAIVEQTAKDGKNLKLGFNINKPDNNQVTVRINALTPVENARNVDLSINLKRSSDNHNFHTDVSLTANDKKYGLVNDVTVSETSPSFDLKVTYPENKQSRISAKFNKASSERFSGELTVSDFGDFSLDASGEATIESLENFLIKLKLNSQKLKLQDINIEILNKPTKTGKKIQLSAKSGNTNLLSGSTSYESKEEAGKLIVQGSGEVQVQDKKKKASFKFIRKNLDETKDGEKGLEVTLDGSLGSKKVVGELILSNKQLHFRKQYCEDNQNCAHVDITSKITAADVQNYHHVLEVSVDLRNLGFKNQCGIKSVYDRKQFSIEHVIDVYSQTDVKTAYQYKLYANPKEAGLQLTLPKRVISIESHVNLNLKQAPKQGSVDAELAIYLNKQHKPNQRLLLSASTNFNVDETRSGSISGELKLSHPALEKDLVLSGKANADRASRTADFNVDIDVFAKKGQKITINGKVVSNPVADKGYNITSEMHIDSKGQNVHVTILEHIAASSNGISLGQRIEYKDAQHSRELVALLVANKEQLEILLHLPHLEPLHLDAKLQLSKNSLVAHSTINVFGMKHLIEDFEIKDMNTLKFTQYSKEQPNEKLNLVAGFAIGQLAEVRLDIIKGGAKQELVHGSLRLDEAHFLQSDYGANVENIKAYLESIRVDLTNILEKVKKLAEQIQLDAKSEMDHVVAHMKTISPNLKPIIEQYKQELQQLREELISDKTIQEATEFLKNTFGATAATINEIVTRLNEIIEKLSKVLHEHFNKLSEVFMQNVLPQLKATAAKLLELATDIAKQLTDIGFVYVSKIADILKTHQADLNKIASSISEMGQDIGRTFAKILREVHTELINFMHAVIEQIKALPVSEIIKEKYSELTGNLNVPDHVVQFLHEFVNTLKGVLPTKELQDMVDIIFDYVSKKLKQEQVDDNASLKRIYASIDKAIKSVIKLLQSQKTTESLQSLIQSNIPLSFGTISRIPSLTIQLSPLRYLLSDDLPTLTQILYSYRPRFNPMDNVPPFAKYALIIQGHHIFTFDRRHLTFPGDCNYVLARDVLDGNFTVIANMANGELKSIQLIDKSGSLTMNHDGTLLKNNKQTEYPAFTETSEAWRRYNSANLKSKYGIQITALPNLKGVLIEVSGYYRNRLRGLLGNPNDEEYDDFMLPNRKVARTESEFGNAYKIGSCPDVKVVDHPMGNHISPVCNNFFGSGSPMRLCYPEIDPALFRDACEHGGGKEETGCLLARGYAVLCSKADILVPVPPACVKCDLDGAKKLNFGETATVQSPKGKADVVILIEQLKFNEPLLKDLVVPLVQQLQNELKVHGIDDIHFALLGYGDREWPSHYTNNGKINYEGKPTTMNFVEPKQEKYFQVGDKKIDDVLTNIQKVVEFLKKDLGLNAAHIAGHEATEYPFRPDAARAVILLQGQNCYAHRTRFGFSTINGLFMMLNYELNGISFNLISPLQTKEGDDKIIGFDSDVAYTIGDAKKKTPEGSSKLKQSLRYESDSCVDFAERENGVVFNSNKFNELKGGAKGQYVQVMAKTISQKISDMEYTRECYCGLDGTQPKTYCVVTSKQNKNTGYSGFLGEYVGDSNVGTIQDAILNIGIKINNIIPNMGGIFAKPSYEQEISTKPKSSAKQHRGRKPKQLRKHK